jgi:hypothetical protein
MPGVASVVFRIGALLLPQPWLPHHCELLVRVDRLVDLECKRSRHLGGETLYIYNNAVVSDRHKAQRADASRIRRRPPLYAGV